MSRGGAESNGERELQAGSLLPAQSPTWGLKSHNCKIMTRDEIKGQTLNQLRHPVTSYVCDFLQRSQTEPMAAPDKGHRGTNNRLLGRVVHRAQSETLLLQSARAVREGCQEHAPIFSRRKRRPRVLTRWAVTLP